MIKVADKVETSDAAWRALLMPEPFDATRGHGTPRTGICARDREKRAGTYACVRYGQRLVSSTAGFESGTGWPSFERSAIDDRFLRTVGVALTVKPGDP